MLWLWAHKERRSERLLKKLRASCGKLRARKGSVEMWFRTMPAWHKTPDPRLNRRGTRPRAPRDDYEWAYIFALCPRRAATAAIVAPTANTRLCRCISPRSAACAEIATRARARGAGYHVALISSFPTTSPSFPRPMPRNSTRSKTSGSICAATSSPSPSTTTTNTSSTRHAKHGCSSPTTNSASPLSPPEHWGAGQSLTPLVSQGDIVVMDDLSSHKGPKVEQLMRAAGAELRYLPP